MASREPEKRNNSGTTKGQKAGSLKKSRTGSCPVCGERHPRTSNEPAFLRPDVIAELPEKDRSRYCIESDDLCDYCPPKPKRPRYFVRGVLPLRVEGRRKPFNLGVWAQVREKDQIRIIELWESPSQGKEPPFPGKLANSVLLHKRTLGLRVGVQLAKPGKRPVFVLSESLHPLREEQNSGITEHRVDEYLTELDRLFRPEG